MLIIPPLQGGGSSLKYGKRRSWFSAALTCCLPDFEPSHLSSVFFKGFFGG